MMHDWFRPPREVKPGWQFGIAFMMIGTWGFAYLLVGRVIFGMAGMVAIGIIVIQILVFYALLNLLDPILRARLRARFRRKV
jgi:hypothetical protein